MPIKRPPLVDNEIYHIILRGASDSLVFKDKNDYFRAIFSLFEFNTEESVEIRQKREERKINGGLSSVDTRKLLVEILGFCFMPNHIHLLIRQINNGGITKFMRKFGTGYALYFNQKYNRKGHLFQGRFRAVHIEDDQQLKIVFVYIHINPISLIEPKWKESGIKNSRKVINFLEKYKWSSYLDYIGKKNFPSLTNRNFLNEIIGGEKICKRFIEDWIKYKQGASFRDVTELE